MYKKNQILVVIFYNSPFSQDLKTFLWRKSTFLRIKKKSQNFFCIFFFECHFNLFFLGNFFLLVFCMSCKISQRGFSFFFSFNLFFFLIDQSENPYFIGYGVIVLTTFSIEKWKKNRQIKFFFYVMNSKVTRRFYEMSPYFIRYGVAKCKNVKKELKFELRHTL